MLKNNYKDIKEHWQDVLIHAKQNDSFTNVKSLVLQHGLDYKTLDTLVNKMYLINTFIQGSEHIKLTLDGYKKLKRGA